MTASIRTRVRAAIASAWPTGLRNADISAATDAVMAELDGPHIVDVGPDRYHLEHPITCRDGGLANCPVDVALGELDQAPATPGRYAVALDDAGELHLADPPDLGDS